MATATFIKTRQAGLDDDDTRELFCIPKDAHTLDGFRKWILADETPEKLKATFIKGQVYIDMSNEEIFTHAAVNSELARVILNLNEEFDFGHLYVNGVLVTNEEAEVSNNPDMTAVFWDSLDNGTVRYVSYKKRVLEIVGAPDWVLEIVSRSSVKKDKKQLREAYHEAGIKEYWVIDARGDDIDFQILQWRKAGYTAAPRKEGWLRSGVFGHTFRLSRKRDRKGAWKYRLESKPV